MADGMSGRKLGSVYKQNDRRRTHYFTQPWLAETIVADHSKQTVDEWGHGTAFGKDENGSKQH